LDQLIQPPADIRIQHPGIIAGPLLNHVESHLNKKKPNGCKSEISGRKNQKKADKGGCF
jgi:hypothetical protein